MGTSILLIFIIPAMIFELIFGFISGALTGYPTAQIELPYDETTGLVWEYDNVDDPYIKLIETKIVDGKQIFVFEGTNKADKDYSGEVMKMIFTDKNGNEDVYYGYHSGKLNAPHIYSDEECRLTEFTLTSDNPVEGGVWEVAEDGCFILCEKNYVSESRTFTAVITPFNIRGEFNDYCFGVKFVYTNVFGVTKELSDVTYRFNDGEHYLNEIKNKTVF